MSDNPAIVFDDRRLFQTGQQFPPEDHIERLAKYQRGRKIFDGKLHEVYERATELLKDSPQADQLSKLYIAINIVDVLITKPADLMFGEKPVYESGRPDDSPEQAALNRIVASNSLNTLGHELVVGNGYRGDAFIKVYYRPRVDLSAIPEGLPKPEVRPEPIIEPVNASFVFPETSRDSNKRFRAVNIAYVEWVRTEKDETPFLVVERHVPGYITYERFKLYPKGIDDRYGAQIEIFEIGENVPTGRDSDIVATGVPEILVYHIPYKATDERWEGISAIEKIESALAAINDRLIQIDYILWKHSDPTAYGPDIGDGEDVVRFGGKYIPVGKDEQTPGYMTWNSQLDGAFRELDYLINYVFQMSETPQWLFGTSITPEGAGGTGTSHTDGAAIRARFMPILSKVDRIRNHVDRAFRDAIRAAMMLENYANEGVEDFVPYDPIRPEIKWKDGLPDNEMELAQIMNIRTGGKPTIDVMTAIKRMDEVDDDTARQIVERIKAEEEEEEMVDASIFRAVNSVMEDEEVEETESGEDEE